MGINIWWIRDLLLFFLKQNLLLKVKDIIYYYINIIPFYIFERINVCGKFSDIMFYYKGFLYRFILKMLSLK